MPKQQQAIRDFSGGINRGANPKNIQENQVVESKNFISDSVGQITTIQNDVVVSTNPLNQTLPSGSERNIHAWASDVGFEITGQSSNVTVPTITEKQISKKARIKIYHSTDYGRWEFPHPVNSKRFRISNLDRMNSEGNPEVVSDWYITKDNSEYTAYTDKEAQGNTVAQLESLIDPTINPAVIYQDESSIPWAWKRYDPNSVDAVSYDADKGSGTDLLSTTTPDRCNDGFSNNFVVVREAVDTDFGSDIATYPVWITEMEFEYYGKINFAFEKNWSRLDKRPASGGHTDDSETISWETFNSEANELSYPSAPDFNEFKGHLLYNLSGASPVYGAFSKWLYGLTNVPYSKVATYSVSIEVWLDFARSAYKSESRTYTNQLGESAEDVINGLFGGGDNRIVSDNIPEAQQVYWKRVDEGVEIFQNANTPKPYGIKTITVSRGAETDETANLGDGDRFSQMVAIANNDSKANIYSMYQDQWGDWQIDLRIDDTVSESPDLTFFDSEGYLSISDMSFRTNNKPKWFGHLKFNKYYLDNNGEGLGSTLQDADFTSTDLCPVPYEEQVHASSSLIQDNTPAQGDPDTTPQWSHMAIDPSDADTLWDGKLNYTTGASKMFFRAKKSASDSTEQSSSIVIDSFHHRRMGVEAAGLKVYPQFLDDTGTIDNNFDQAVDAQITGSFTKEESVQLYFSYVYEGGYVSKPKRFQVDATNGSTEFQSTATKEDSRAFGVMVLIGRQLIGGDGTNGYNERLNKIEIWAKYTKTDPSNIYLICDIDLNKGWRSNLVGDWTPLSPVSIQEQLHGYSTGEIPVSGQSTSKRNNYMIFTSPNTIESFYDRYNIDYKDTIGFDSGGTGWKTACIFNRRAYYGNISIVGKDGGVVNKPDGILKSAIGMYNTVGISNLVEATINDGDEITSLQVVGNKLCQFKKYSLTIMGIKILENGESREIIEQIIHHVGILSENQVCQTPYGLFWVSRSGVYIYNGESVQRLTENPEGSTISKVEWEAFYGKRLHCGYDAYWNQVLIARDTIYNNETLIYSFNNKAFSSSNDLFNTSKKSGFTQTRNGHLMWAEEFNNIVTTINNCVTVDGSKDVTFPDNVAVVVGETVNGDGIPLNTIIDSVTVVAGDTDTFTMSNEATASATVSLTIGQGVTGAKTNRPNLKPTTGFTQTNSKVHNNYITA